MPELPTKCHVCLNKVMPDEDGRCPKCRTQLDEVAKDPNEELQFFCVVCDDFFFSLRDDTGNDQAPCPTCGDISNTTEFHTETMVGDKLADSATRNWILRMLAYLLLSGVGVSLIKSCI